jgi:CcmD family protein
MIRMLVSFGVFIIFLGATGTTDVVISDNGPEANLPFLFAAFAIAWLGFIVYAWYLASQHSRLRQDLANMQNQLTDIQNSINNQ